MPTSGCCIHHFILHSFSKHTISLHLVDNLQINASYPPLVNALIPRAAAAHKAEIKVPLPPDTGPVLIRIDLRVTTFSMKFLVLIKFTSLIFTVNMSQCTCPVYIMLISISLSKRCLKQTSLGLKIIEGSRVSDFSRIRRTAMLLQPLRKTKFVVSV